jgi:hypothetical protein
MSLSPFHYVAGLRSVRTSLHYVPYTPFHCKRATSLSNPRKSSPFTAFRNLTPELHSTAAKVNGILFFIGIHFRCSSISPGYCSIPLVATLAFPPLSIGMPCVIITPQNR